MKLACGYPARKEDCVRQRSRAPQYGGAYRIALIDTRTVHAAQNLLTTVLSPPFFPQIDRTCEPVRPRATEANVLTEGV